MDARPVTKVAADRAGTTTPLTTGTERAAAQRWADNTALHLTARVVGVVDDIWPEAYRAGAHHAHHCATARVIVDTTVTYARTGDGDDPTGAVRAGLAALGDVARKEQAQPPPVTPGRGSGTYTVAVAVDAARRAGPRGDHAAYAAAVDVAVAAAHRGGAGSHAVGVGVRLLEVWQNDIYPRLPPAARIEGIPADQWATRTIQAGIRDGLRVEPVPSAVQLARASFAGATQPVIAAPAATPAATLAAAPAARAAASHRRSR